MKNLKPLLAFGTLGATVLGWFGWQLFSIVAPSADFASAQSEAPPPAATATVHFSSTPPGADATTSVGWACRTPCSMELMTDAPVTVTFAHEGFAPVTMPVQVQSSELISDASAGNNTVSAVLKPLRQELVTGSVRRTNETRKLAAVPRRNTRAAETDNALSKAWKAFASLFGDASR